MTDLRIIDLKKLQIILDQHIRAQYINDKEAIAIDIMVRKCLVGVYLKNDL